MIQTLSPNQIPDIQTGLIWVTAKWCDACNIYRDQTLKAAEQILIPIYEVDLVALDCESDYVQDWGLKNLPAYVMFIRGELVSKIEGTYSTEFIVSQVEGWMDERS